MYLLSNFQANKLLIYFFVKTANLSKSLLCSFPFVLCINNSPVLLLLTTTCSGMRLFVTKDAVNIYISHWKFWGNSPTE